MKGNVALTSGDRPGTLPPPPPQGCTGKEGTSEAALRPLDRRLEEAAKAVGGGYCRLQMPLRLALGVRGAVPGRRMGALGGGGGVPANCTSSIRQLLGAADVSTAHANAERTPAGAPAAAADRKQRPDATCEGKTG